MPLPAFKSELLRVANNLSMKVRLTKPRLKMKLSNKQTLKQHEVPAYFVETATNQSKWYEKTWLVIVLCIIFFPVGLYALWNNSSISKGWKIGATIVIALIILGQFGDHETTDISESNLSSLNSSSQMESVQQIAPAQQIVPDQQIEPAQKYIKLAERYYEEGDLEQSVKFLSKGFDETRDFNLTSKMIELDSESLNILKELNVNKAITTFDFTTDTAISIWASYLAGELRMMDKPITGQ